MGFELYDSWSTEESESIGKKFVAKCKHNGSYENCLTVGENYIIEITPRILSLTPLCSFIGDKNKKGKCHLTRFEKIKEVED